MPDFSTPILIFGDAYISKDKILAVKKKYSSAIQVTMSAAKISPNEIRAEIGTSGWGEDQKLVFIEDIPNRKEVRKFLLNIAAHPLKDVKIIVWDSTNQIKPDPKTKKLNKTWGGFVQSFKDIPDAKVINNGAEFTHKDKDTCVSFVRGIFKKHAKEVSDENIKLLMEIVGKDRGLLKSDIEKLCLTSPKVVTSDFILENAFPTSKEAVLYQFGNVLDDASYDEAINMLEKFLAAGINPNVLAEVFMRKARWQLAATYFWVHGVGWSSISTRLMSMGQFPSQIWHNPQISNKKEVASDFQGAEGILKYMVFHNGLPGKYFPNLQPKKKKIKVKLKRAERMPFAFQADQTVNFVRDQIVGNCSQDDPSIKERILNRALKVYLFIQEQLADIRYNANNAVEPLYEMTKVMTDVRF